MGNGRDPPDIPYLCGRTKSNGRGPHSGRCTGTRAIAWRIGELAAPFEASPAYPFRIAFLLVAAVSLAGVWDCARLPVAAGEAVTKRDPGNLKG
jgi:hypothetical protein